MTTPRAVSVTVSGVVQGVSFRASCAQVARTHRVTGWVSNRTDGMVELFAEGLPDDVEALIDWCHDGPDAARVDDVEVRDVAPEGYESFDIHR